MSTDPGVLAVDRASGWSCCVGRACSAASSRPASFGRRPTARFPHGLAGVAKAMCWWGLGIESLIAVLWLCPVRTPLSLKDASLIGFLVTTYMLLPVVGFASVLGVMGFSVAFLENRRRLAFVYLIALCFVQLASIPWGSYATMHLAH